MGRPRRHDDAARESLLEAAERLAVERGIDAVGVRSAAAAAATTTRAVYTVFGSKHELLEGLAQRAFELLVECVAAVPRTDDPVRNLVEAAVHGFRGFVISHPELYRFVCIEGNPAWRSSAEVQTVARESYAVLLNLVAEAQSAGFGRGLETAELAALWDALCSGLAFRELCGGIAPADSERIWRRGLGALVLGLGGSPASLDSASA